MRHPHSMHELSLDAGKYAGRLARIAVNLEGDVDGCVENLDALLEDSISSDSGVPLVDHAWVRFLFGCSVLVDLVELGGRVIVRDSRIFVSWPDWEGPNGKEVARKALKAASDLRPLTQDEVSRVMPVFARDTDGWSVAQALAEGDVWLERAEEIHPSGVRYMEAFSAALRLWTMPYRGRQGRMKRFVVLCKHGNFGQNPVVAGLIEMGDEAPFCTWRDSLLGLEPRSAIQWLSHQEDPKAWAKQAIAHLRCIRRALLPTHVELNLATTTAKKIVGLQERLEKAAAGRSVVDEDFKERKRIAYAVRLARGEIGLGRIEKGLGTGFSEDSRNGLDSDLAAGVRAIHDLVLPRVHMEACVCGPVPPFSYGLGGKLVVGFLAHPWIVELPTLALGTVLEQSFDLNKLLPRLPNQGMLALTTKGLYARHSPMYHRAEVPGLGEPLRFKRVHETEGTTTSFLSDRTAKLARAVLDSAEEKSTRQVSRVYGTGGAKRHRTIEQAARIVGIPQEVVLAGIRRPVYAIKYASNPEEVIWCGADPKWKIDRKLDADAFCEAATRSWRTRWLGKAERRLSDYAFLPSPTKAMETKTTGDASE